MNCHYCNEKTPEEYLNYCSNECQIDEAIADGAKVLCPNALPITTITSRYVMENGHADHPDYRFPVRVEQYMDVVEKDGDMKLYEATEPTEWLLEDHALIYSDGSIALTIYECCYFMWKLTDGLSLNDKTSPMRLSAESLDKIKSN
jgi:hypothetical protein